MPSTIAITGSWGTLHVCPTTGKVVSRHDLYPNDPQGYRTIIKFDVAEWRRTYPGTQLQGGDILDFGYWTEDGHYEEPAYDWRRGFGHEAHGFVLSEPAAKVLQP
jgi:hypothetical protein